MMNAFDEEGDESFIGGGLRGLQGQHRDKSYLPNYRKFIVRLKSFQNFQCHDDLKFKFASAGFFYDNDDALIECSHCSLQFSNLSTFLTEENSKGALDCHIKLDPNCRFVSNRVEKKFVGFYPNISEILAEIDFKEGEDVLFRLDECQLAKTEGTYTCPARHLDLTKICQNIAGREIKADVEANFMVCKVCLLRPAKVITFPCHHLHMCEFCVDMVHQCVVCKSKILACVKVYN